MNQIASVVFEKEKKNQLYNWRLIIIFVISFDNK